MFLFKRIFVLIITFVIITSASFAQQNREMTIEESYLRETIELMIIRETARSSTRDQKLIALEYIDENIKRNGTNTSDEVRQTLDYLAREGRGSVTRENNRVVNNFPDIRRQAARYLGQLKTDEAKRALYDICQNENEPTVLQEAIKSLGEIGKNENNETVERIVWVVTRFDTLGITDNVMAVATIDAIEKIAESNNGINSPAVIEMLIKFQNQGKYITPVREKARMLLAKLRSYGG